jgi:hypothetical protein
MVGIRSAVGWLASMLRGHSRFGPLFGRLEKWRSYLPLVIALAVGTLIIVWTADAFIDIAIAWRRSRESAGSRPRRARSLEWSPGSGTSRVARWDAPPVA